MQSPKSDYQNYKQIRNNNNKNLKKLGQSNFSMRGTTLIELLLYIGLLSIFLGVLTGLFGTAIDILLSTQSTSGVAIDSTYLLSRLKYDIQRAESVTIPSDLGSTSSTLTLVIGGIDYVYTLDGSGNLIYTNNLGTFSLNSYLANITQLTFTRIGNVGGIEPTIKIDMLINSLVHQSKGEESAQISTTVALHRNQ